MAVYIIRALISLQRHLSPKYLLRHRVVPVYHSTGVDTEAQSRKGCPEPPVSPRGGSALRLLLGCGHTVALVLYKMGVVGVICYIMDFFKRVCVCPWSY